MQPSTTKPLTLEQSLRLAGQNLLAILNPEDNCLPYWEATVRENQPAAFKRWWPAHNIGRWWDAMLRLEAATGFKIPPQIEEAMLKNIRRFFDNPDSIILNPDLGPLHPFTHDEGMLWDLHSLREGMLGLYALVRWRQDAWAAETGKKMVRSLATKLRDDGDWDIEKFDACQKRGKNVIHNAEPCDTHGRLLEALVWFFEVTGDADTLRLADRIAGYHFANTTRTDGEMNRASRPDHTHSYLGTLRGLLLYGQLTNQQEYIGRVATAYRVTVPRYVHESGYTSHNMVVESFGETTSPGDAAQLALWLSRLGYAEFLDDAERLVRARILPSQIRESPPIRPVAEDGKDPHRDIAGRIIGAYGGCHSHPHGGKLAVTDVTAADVHTLVDIYQNIAVREGNLLKVFFHMDYEDSHVRVVCRRERRAELTVTPKADTTVALRLPKWTPRESVQLRVGSQKVTPLVTGQFIWAGKVPARVPLTMEYDLPARRTQEKDLGTDYEIFWCGDDVTGVRPNIGFYPFYPNAPAT
jgi:hypothetical protein